MPLNDLHRPLQETVSLTAAKRSLQSSINEERGSRSAVEGEMANRSTCGDRPIDRRTVLQAGAVLATAGPALLRGVHAEAQPRPRMIVDSQVHAYEANTQQRPWFRVPN